MSNKIWKSVFVVCAAGCLASCSDQMDYNEYNIFDKDYITQNFGNVGGFMTDIYNTVDYAAEMFNLCRQHMNMATSFSSDINEKGLKHTIDTMYSYHET